MPRIATVLALVLCASGLAPAQTLDERIASILSAPAARGATWGIHAVSADSGAVLYSRNASSPLTPASNTKLFTTAFGLLKLGPDYRFETRVLAAARPDPQGVLHGDLRLVGGGDPTLSARRIPYEKGPIEGDPLAPLALLADQIAAAGVRVINGDLIGDDTRWPHEPYPGGWAIGDMPWDYGAPVSALTLNDNSLTLTVRPGKAPGDPATVTLVPPVEYFTLRNTLRTLPGAERRISIDRAPASRVLEISGTAPPNSAALTDYLAVDDPAAFTAEAFAQLLRARGISIRGRVLAAHRPSGVPYSEPAGVVLASRHSPPLVETLKVIDKVSQNLHAEMVLREIGRATRGEGTAQAAHKEIAAWLESLGADKRDFDFEDGSGLSRRTLVSPQTVTAVLRALHLSEHREAFRGLLPIAAEDGTLSSRFRGEKQAALVRAKTGSISHVAALSGYAGDDPARRIAFSVIVNGATAPSFAVRTLIDKIVIALLEEGNR